MCGEHCTEHVRTASHEGSSPHVRGAPDTVHQRRIKLGIIPACAGSTPMPNCRAPCSRDHPRMCGEHTIVVMASLAGVGSSPHVRGAQHSACQPRTPHGIIPACAGSTDIRLIAQELNRDHPRMCGEHLSRLDSNQNKQGSSPHVRGAPTCRLGVTAGNGIIPACAGSTLILILPWLLTRDHPRMCGEHFSHVFRIERPQGSSPHVRGALHL